MIEIASTKFWKATSKVLRQTRQTTMIDLFVANPNIYTYYTVHSLIKEYTQ